VPARERLERIGIRLTPRDLAALDQFAAEIHGTRSNAVQRLLHQTLGKQ